ncbi:MAG: hypothetical protein NTY38_09335, partial [Acidobacteria bacterium]|nr:hypothetical protein [Acidobacteriota bacterium]
FSPAAQAYAPPAYQPPPAFAPPQPNPGYGYAPPAPAPAAYGAPGLFAPPAAGGGPMPPAMHWGVVLILAWITGGLAGIVWAFKQASFVKKIDPSSKAVLTLTLCVVVVLAQLALFVVAMSAAYSGSASGASASAGLGMLLNLVALVLSLVTMFGMRSSIVRYYNTVEPINLKLSGVMTFFFNILYFQYHFSRIAEWKKTGRLQ